MYFYGEWKACTFICSVYIFQMRAFRSVWCCVCLCVYEDVNGAINSNKMCSQLDTFIDYTQNVCINYVVCSFDDMTWTLLLGWCWWWWWWFCSVRFKFGSVFSDVNGYKFVEYKCLTVAKSLLYIFACIIQQFNRNSNGFEA